MRCGPRCPLSRQGWCQVYEDEYFLAGIRVPLDANGNQDPRVLAANATIIAIALLRNPRARSLP